MIGLAIVVALLLFALLADEPTTALDVTIQAQMLALLLKLQRERGMALVLITHDLGVVAEVAQRVLVMHAGKVVEQAPKLTLFSAPRHPCTRALLASTPRIDAGAHQQKQVLSGELPSPLNPPSGCAFHKRCPQAVARCQVEVPVLQRLGDGQHVACHRVHELG